jgi:ribosome-associated heat shock protein Hsp15
VGDVVGARTWCGRDDRHTLRYAHPSHFNLTKRMAQPNEDRPTLTGTQRLDKWLWFARVVKTRTQAAALVTDGRVRINTVKTDRPAQPVRIGDMLTIAVHDRIRILEVVLPGEKRGGAPEAGLLFKDHSPPPPPRDFDAHPDGGLGVRDAGSGRPTKRDRRLLDKLRSDED